VGNVTVSFDATNGEVPTVVHMLQESVNRFPDNEAVVFGDARLTYRELANEIICLASKLSKLGSRGDRVAIVMSNGPAIVISMYAVYAAGMQAVPLNPEYTERELGAILIDADVLVVLCGDAQYARVGTLLDSMGRKPAMLLPDLPQQAASVPSPTLPLPDLAGAAKLQYTGGTTGRSKGVILTHANVAVNVLQREALIPMSQGRERILCVTPLYHAYATAMALYPALSSGSALIILPRFKPELVFEAIERERITLFAGAPSIYYALVGHPEFEHRDFSTLSASFSGSAPLPLEVLQKWQNITGAPILEGYGLTESSPILTFNPRYGVRKAGSVGVAAPNTTVQIVIPDDRSEVLGSHEIGEVRAKGPQLMAGYRNLPDETSAAIRGGWLYTGDLGELDDEGYLFIRGRQKEMVIVGGFNVYPREIEELLFALPFVRDCGVVGVSHPYRGEVVCAFLVLDPGATVTESEILTYCQENLVRYKVPAAVHFVQTLPRTAVGKLDRATLSDMGKAQMPDRKH